MLERDGYDLIIMLIMNILCVLMYITNKFNFYDFIVNQKLSSGTRAVRRAADFLT